MLYDYTNVKVNRDTIIEATIYEFKFTPPFEHILENICYFGQTIRKLSLRIKEHKSDAKKNIKEFGLHALWVQYPHDHHWAIRSVEVRKFEDRIEACKWLNIEEKRLIDLNGGPLQTMDNSVKQTLNLTTGGQGDPEMKWAKILKMSRKKMEKVIRPAFERFYAINGHLRVKIDYVDEEGVNLGSITDNIRSRGDFLHHPDFKKYLEDNNFTFDANRCHFDEVIRPAFERFYAINGHLRVKIDYVDEEGVKLGSITSTIRSQNSFLQYPGFKKYLEDNNFTFDSRRAHLDEVIRPAFERFYAINGHLRIKIDYVDEEGVKLGKITDNIRIRNRGDFLQYPDFKKYLEDNNFTFDANRSHLDEVVRPAFERFYTINGHLRVNQRYVDEEGVNLGQITSGIRSQNCFLQYPDFKKYLEDNNFTFDANRSHFYEVVRPAFERFYAINGHLRVKRDYVDEEGVNLGQITGNIRSQNSFLHHPDFKKYLKDNNFAFDANHSHFDEVIRPAFERFYAINGHLRVKRDYVDEEGVNLGQITSRIRNRKSFLQYPDFKKYLEDNNFTFDANRSHLDEVVRPAFERFYTINGHLRVKIDYVDEEGVKLGKITSTIRSQNCFLQYPEFKKYLEDNNFAFDANRSHLDEVVRPAFERFYAINGHLRVKRDYVDEEGVNLGQITGGIRSRENYLQYPDFSKWLWCGGFKMATRDEKKNSEKWKAVLKE